MTHNNLPEFLIVGAAKSGTTSLHNYLSKHKDVHMSKHKEPKYFSYTAVDISFSGPGDKDVEYNIVKNQEQYKKLFKTNKKIKGESSADNLYYYKEVIPLIKNKLNQPKIVIILRNPIQRAFSAYMHLRRDGREKETFEKALTLEEGRIENGFEFIWHYKNVGLYYNQVKAYLENFQDCKVLLLEDLNTNKEKTLEDVFNFLKIKNINLKTEKIYNPSGIPKNTAKSNFYFSIINSGFLKNLAYKILSEKLRKKIGYKMKKVLVFSNLEKQILNEETKNKLISFYEEDIIKLESLIQRDLSHWLK